MKKLEEYEVLKTVFYRGVSILEYIRLYPNLDDLDVEAIKATIMNALVDSNSIHPEREFLSLDSCAITNNPADYHYGKFPFVMGYPLWLKDKMRNRIIRQSGSIPISVHASRPSGRVSYCIYDANTTLSVFFEDFAFIEADYSSPTRQGVRVEKRPFLEVFMNDRTYLVDVLTKRFFEEEEFAKRYGLTVSYRIRKKDFNRKQKEIYAEQTEESKEGYGSFLALSLPMLSVFSQIPKFQEYLYELEESKKHFEGAWEDAFEIMKACSKEEPPKIYFQKKSPKKEEL